MLATVSFWTGLAALGSSGAMMLEKTSSSTTALLIAGCVGALALFFRTVAVSASAPTK